MSDEPINIEERTKEVNVILDEAYATFKKTHNVKKTREVLKKAGLTDE